MKYAARMVLVPETEYLALQAGSYKNKTTPSLKRQAINLSQDLGKRIRQRKQIVKLDIQPGVNILEHLPPIYQPKAKLLLKELKSRGVAWTGNRELITSNGLTIADSNIIDLIKEALVSTTSSRHRPKPHGWEEFITDIANLNVPLTLFTKASTLTAVDRARTQNVMPVWDEL